MAMRPERSEEALLGTHYELATRLKPIRYSI
jgi:hypothetical protein